MSGVLESALSQQGNKRGEDVFASQVGSDALANESICPHIVILLSFCYHNLWNATIFSSWRKIHNKNTEGVSPCKRMRPLNKNDPGVLDTATLLDRMKQEMPDIWGKSPSRRQMGMAGIQTCRPCRRYAPS